MLIALVVVIVSDHFVRLALETHTLITSTASHSITTVYPDNRDLALIVWTLPNTIFQHIFFKKFISTGLGFLTSQSRVIFILNKTFVTLHSIQKVDKQTSH